MKYDVICTDKPWNYGQRSCWSNSKDDVKSRTKFGGGAGGDGQNSYDLMTDQRLIEACHEISKIAADDAVMFMWAVWPRLDFCLEAMKACGFEYKTCAFVWEKTNKDGSPATSPGFYTASCSEPVLLGVKRKKKAGKFSLTPAKRLVNQIVRASELFEEDSLADVDTIVDHMNGQVILSPRSKHSQKPETVQDRIDLMYPTQKKLELFARRTRPGWVCTGNQNDTNQMDVFEFLKREIAENEQSG